MMRSVCIVSCSAHKRGLRTWAENLYASESFFLSRRYAQANFDKWLIFSAKHGILKPGDIIEPYDLHIDRLSCHDRLALVNTVRTQIQAFDPSINQQYMSFCVEAYTDVLNAAGLHPQIPAVMSLPSEEKLARLRYETDPLGSERNLDEVYQIVQRLVDAKGLRPFSEVIREAIPPSGVYLFFDPREPRLRNINQLRIVRVGTHGVASGSKATLRDRMRTHFGTTAGGGNHRSSVFRLHIGRSMIEGGVTKDVPSWGSTELPKASNLRKREDHLEAKVSNYIGELLVTFIEVPGDSSKSNDRAYLEQNLIALLSNCNRPLDLASHRWLGLSSDKPEICKSGIWNVNHTAQTYDPSFLAMLDYYVSLTLGVRQLGSKPVAPQDWIATVRRDVRQLTLL